MWQIKHAQLDQNESESNKVKVQMRTDLKELAHN